MEYLNATFNINSNELIDVFDELPFWSAPFGIALLDKIKFKKHINVLDIGSGTGFPLIELAMRLGQTCRIIGLDPWKEAVKRADKKIKFYGIKNIKIIEGIAEEIPLESKSIDLIVSNNGLNNTADLDQSLSECSRVIKSGGQFIQAVNLDRTMIEFYDIFENLLYELNMNKEIQKLKMHIYKKRRPLDELLDKIQGNSFNIIEAAHSKFEYKFNDGTAMLNHYFIRLAFLNEWKNILPEKKQSQIFEELEARINKKAGSHSLFKLSIPFIVIDALKR